MDRYIQLVEQYFLVKGEDVDSAQVDAIAQALSTEYPDIDHLSDSAMNPKVAEAVIRFRNDPEGELRPARSGLERVIDPFGAFGAEELAEIVELSDEELAYKVVNDPDSLTPEQAELAAMTAAVQRVIAELEGQQQVPSWVYLPGAENGRIMRQLTDGDLDDIIRLALETGLVTEDILLANPFDGEPRDATMRRNLTGFILPSQSVLAQALIEDWGIENEARADDWMVNGQPLSLAQQYARALGVSTPKAASVLNQANAAGMPTDLFAAAWGAQGGKQQVRQLGSADSSERAANAGRPVAGAGKASPGSAAADRARRHDGDGPPGARWGSLLSAHTLGKKLSEGMELYGDQMTAAVHAANPDLARKMYEDPWSLNREELAAAIDAVGDNEFAGGLAQLQWLRDRRDGQLDVSQGQTVQTDTAGAQEYARQLAASWNLPGIPDSALGAVASAMMAEAGKLLSQSLPNPFNPDMAVGGGRVVDQAGTESIVRRALRGLPIYDQLFGNMAEGETEEVYAGRMTGQAEMLLGRNMESGDASRAGMRSGDINTVGQQAVTSGQALESSTFQQRLVGIAEAFRSMT